MLSYKTKAGRSSCWQGRVPRQCCGDFASILEYGQAIRDELLGKFSPSDFQSKELISLNRTSFQQREVVGGADQGMALVVSPSVGFGRYAPDNTPPAPVTAKLHDRVLHLQNGLSSVKLSEKGEVLELVGLESGQRVLSEPDNPLMLHENRPSLWVAWDIEPSVLEAGRASEPATKRHILSRGPLRAEIVFERSIARTLKLNKAHEHYEVRVAAPIAARRATIPTVRMRTCCLSC